jgi:hypothetical protein
MSNTSESANQMPASAPPANSSGYEPRAPGNEKVRTNLDPGDSVSRKRSFGPVMKAHAEPLRAEVEQEKEARRFNDRRGTLGFRPAKDGTQGVLSGQEPGHHVYHEHRHDGHGRTYQEPRLRAAGDPEEGMEGGLRDLSGHQGIREAHEGEGNGSGLGSPSFGPHGSGLGDATGGVDVQDAVDGQGQGGCTPHDHDGCSWSIQVAGTGIGNGLISDDTKGHLHYGIGVRNELDHTGIIKAFVARKDDAEYAKIRKLQGPANWIEWKEDIRFIRLEKGLDEYVLDDPPEVLVPKHLLRESSASEGPTTRRQTAKTAALSEDDQEAQLAYEVAVEELKEWQKESRKAAGTLGLYLEPGQRMHVNSCRTGREMWIKLCKLYDCRDEATQMALESELASMVMKPSESISSWICRVETLGARCKAAGMYIEEKRLVRIILHGLTPAFETKAKLLMHDASNGRLTMTVSTVSTQLLADEKSEAYRTKHIAMYARPNNPGPRSGTKDKQSDKDKKKKRTCKCRDPNCNAKCPGCNKWGHHEDDCWTKHPELKPNGNGKGGGDDKKSEANKSDDKVPAKNESVRKQVALMARTGPTPEVSISDWVLDSGCTDHIIRERSAFEDLAPHRVKVETANEAGRSSCFFTEARGTACIRTIVDNQCIVLRLHNAYYAPDATESLISLGYLVDKGVEFVMKKNRTVGMLNGEPIIEATMRQKLFYIRAILEPEHDSEGEELTSYYSKVDAEGDTELWHRRLGHVGYKTLQQTIKVSEGIEPTDDVAYLSCVACHTGKVPRDSFPTSQTRASKLQVISADMAGPIETPTPEGGRYFLVIKDEYSSYKKVYILAHKSDAMACLKQYIALAENLCEVKVKVVRTDQDSVFCSADAEQWFSDNGYRHEKSITYTAQQNGHAERSVRSIKDIARTVLEDARILMLNDLDKRLWGEACKTAAYLDNRVAKQRLEGLTPFEALLGTKPELAHLRVFGCPAYVFVPKQLRDGTFEPRKELRVFVGYSDQVKGWRFFDVETGKFSESESVKFIEGKQSQEPTIEHTGNLEGELEDIEPEPEQDVSTQLKGEMNGGAPPSPIRVLNPTGVIARVQPRRDRRPRSEWQGGLAALMAKTELDQLPKSYADAISRRDGDEWAKAIKSEKDSLDENQVYELIDTMPSGRKAVGTRWVFTEKEAVGDEPARKKARLVAKGFSQIEGIDFVETYAPVARATSIRIFFSMAASRDLEMIQVDVVTAFLYGKLDEEIYCQQPPGLEDKDRPRAVWRLKKALYGLKQAPKVWYETLREVFERMNFVVVQAESCIFRAARQDGVVWVIAYVDDMIVASEKKGSVESTIASLSREFRVKILGQPSKFLGFEINRDSERRTITLSQRKYAEKVLDRFSMSECHPIDTPMQVGTVPDKGDGGFDGFLYKQAAGSLNYLYTMTRPDIGYM